MLFRMPAPFGVKSWLTRFLRAGVMGVLAAPRLPFCKALYSDADARLPGWDGSELKCFA